MLLPVGRRRHLLSYEMNVHRGESRKQFFDSVRRFVLPIRDGVVKLAGPLVATSSAATSSTTTDTTSSTTTDEFGIAPRVGRGLLKELGSRRQWRELRDELKDLGLFAFTINAFPLEDFHARRVKEQVYSPPWTDSERYELTNRICNMLAVLLPEGVDGTVSTLGGTYRRWGHDIHAFHRMAGNYLRTVRHLANLEARTGRYIALTAEPEPDTTFETASDVITLVEENMRPLLREIVARPLGVTLARAEEIFHRYFQVNLDVCHQSVLFRDPVKEWRLLERAGLRVGKLHLTNALALPNPGRSRTGLRELRAYHEPRYLHQVALRRKDGGLERGADLPTLDNVDLTEIDEVRCHFHVPLSRARVGRLATTRAETERALHYALRKKNPPHLVIETYTWPLLEGGRSRDDMIDGIVREFRWALQSIRGA